MMNDLESRLKEMPLAKPSPRLRQRIFDGIPDRRRRRGPASIFQVRIPLGWAAAAAILMGVVGFVAARQTPAPSQTVVHRGSSRVEVRIVEVPAGRPHFFDFTGATDDFLPRDSEVRIETGGNL